MVIQSRSTACLSADSGVLPMEVAKKALKGTFFVAANSYVSLFIAFVTGVALARLLDPADFGIYRIALFFADLAGRIKEFGLDKALVHKQDDLRDGFRTHFTLQAVLAFLGLVISILISPIIIKYYPPVVVTFVIMISLFYLFQSLSSTQRIFLEKSLQFKYTALVDILSLVLSSVISVVMAYKGFGALSLVMGYGLNFLFSFVLLWLLRPWKISLSEAFLFNKNQISWFIKFGSFLFLGGLTTFVLYKYNDFVLGTFLSATALGFYTRAFNYAQLPTSLITSVVSKVALPTYSLVQGDPAKLSSAFSLVLGSIVRISFPFSLLLFLTADEFTLFLLGPKWLPMVPILRILLVYGVLRSIFDDLGEFFTAIGKPRIVSFYLMIQALISLVLSPLLTHLYGSAGAALSLTIVLALGVFIAYFLMRRLIGLSIVKSFLPTLLVCFLTLQGFNLTLAYWDSGLFNTLSVLVWKSLVFSFYYLIFMLVIDGRAFLRDLRFMLGHLR